MITDDLPFLIKHGHKNLQNMVIKTANTVQ